MIRGLRSFIPFYATTLRTSLSASDVHDALARITSAKASFFRFKDEGVRFYGRVGELEFRIVRRIRYRNSFLPVISGRIAPNARGVEVHLRMRMHAWVIAFMAVWMTGATAVGVMSVIAAVTQRNPSALLGLVFPLAGALSAFGFRYEANTAIEELAALWSAVGTSGAEP